jgi:AAA domain
VRCSLRRCRSASVSLRGQRCPYPDNLIYLTHADYDSGIPDLFEPGGHGQELVEHAIQASGAELVIFDNISALFRTGEENSNDSWVSAGEWLLSLRRQNLTSLLIHHAGKRLLDGTLRQRGASKREDLMDA